MNNRIKKVILWRILSTIIALLITYFFLGQIHKTVEVVATLTITMTILHYHYERWWENYTKQKE